MSVVPSAKECIEQALKASEWKIQDAKRRLVEESESLLRRAQSQLANAQRIQSEGVGSLSESGFVESALRSVKEAESELQSLLNQEKAFKHMLSHINGDNA